MSPEDDVDEASPPLPDWVLDAVLLFPDAVLVALFVEVELPPVSPPRAPLPPVVVEPFWMLPPSPPLPVAPELPDVAEELQLALPMTVTATQRELLPPVSPELPDAPPLPALLLLVLSAAPPLPPEPPSPVLVFDELELVPLAVESPPVVDDVALDDPPSAREPSAGPPLPEPPIIGGMPAGP